MATVFIPGQTNPADVLCMPGIVKRISNKLVCDIKYEIVIKSLLSNVSPQSHSMINGESMKMMAFVAVVYSPASLICIRTGAGVMELCSP